MGSLNIYGVYGDVNKDLDTDNFCTQQDISIESNKDFKALLWYMLGNNGWEENRDLHYDNWALTELLSLPKEVEGSRLRTIAETVDKEGYIHGGVYLNSLFIPKLFFNISSTQFDLARRLPYEALVMYNEVHNICRRINPAFDRRIKDRFIDHNDYTKSEFYTNKELEAFKRYQVPRLELDADGILMAVSPDGIVMNINDVEEPDMLLSLIFFFNRGYSYLDKKKIFAIVVPKHFRYAEFPVFGGKDGGWLHFLNIATTIKNDYLLKNVTLIYDEDIKMNKE